MKDKRILILGYGINKSRTEAVSLNTCRLAEHLEKIGHRVYVYNIGYANQYFYTGSSMVEALLKRNKILDDLKFFIKTHKIEVIHDVFVLPLASLLFTLPLKNEFVKVLVKKEVHNDAGFSKHLHTETLIRMLANNQWELNTVLKYLSCFTRNFFISQKYNLTYVPVPVTIKPLSKIKTTKHHIGYLGHPLSKKGVFEFPKLFQLIDPDLKDKIVFNFAFSSIGKREEVIKLIKEKADIEKIQVSFEGKVDPHTFFSKQDYYILPIQDQYGSVSTPNTVLEAMEAGAIPIVTRIPSLKGLLVDKENGYFIEQPRAIEAYQVLKKSIQRKDINSVRSKARRFIEENFSEEKYRSKIESLYVN